MLLAIRAQAVEDRNAYYGFFPSERGSDYKKFVHNILGFSIDIPSTWIFGVSGTPPTAVVFLYREGLDTGKISKDYETIEIGQIPSNEMNLAEAYNVVMRGMKAKHPKFIIVKEPFVGKINGLPSMSWIYDWPSKTGFTVTEYITLVKSPDSIRSLAVRTTLSEYSSKLEFWDSILQTFEPFKPKY